MAPKPFEIFTIPWRADSRLGISRLPGADAVPQIRGWGAALVVSLTPADEMAQFQAESLPERLSKVGIGWRHVPIADFGAPASPVAAQWPSISDELRSLLDGGESVLVHCRGGCGRSGMIAMRLLVDAGEPPDVALARVRAVRPCAVETAEQEAWAARGGGRG